MKIAYLLLVLVIVSFGVEGADLYAVCRKTLFADLCIQTLKADPRSAKADVKGLARLILEANLATAKRNFIQIVVLLKRTGPGEVRSILQTCQANYSGLTTRDLPNAVHLIAAGNLVQAHQSIEDADDAEGNCHDAMEGSSLVGSSVATANERAENLSVIALEILSSA